MQTSPLISVIIPVYNGAEYIETCFQSIISQSYQNLEIIIINDGSEDNSSEICDYYASKDQRIKVIHQENKGLSAVRNRGVRESKGDYIGFVDSDDYIHSDMYKILLNNLLLTNAGVSMCNFKKVYQRNFTNNKNNELPDSEKLNVISKQEAFEHLFADTNVNLVVPWNKLYKKEIIRKVQYPEGKVHDDEFTVHHIIQATNKIVITEQNLYYYYHHPSSFMNESYNLKRLDAVTALRERFEFFMNNKYIQFQSRALNMYMHHLIIHYNLLEKNLPEETLKLKELIDMYRSDFNKYQNLLPARRKIELHMFFIHPQIFKLYIFNRKKLYNLKINTLKLKRLSKEKI
ncbi:glycosyltransferase family 2 protein [Alkalicoccus daliensis]|uniref:Glycosyltransferase involved in cell wall bisynthesis n=1 Tax=Alkalicoccus daliensis TaxID=745820 RepID=A0A1G9ZPJ3_9BACI|nr:glycosyltransferase [Alkalicoccus daliensis]SDN22516.1 Glycosyltransferase involved in cell wall bisynthesis [Alkalicoccus daliensis]